MFSMNSATKIFVIKRDRTCHLLCKRLGWYHSVSKTGSLSWHQFMLQWFIQFPEFTEFPFNSGKTPTLFYIVYKSLCCVYQVEDKSLKKWLRIKTMRGTLSHPGKTFSEQKRMYMTIEFIYQMRFGVSHNVASLHGLNGIRIISCFVSEQMPELNHMIEIHGPDAGTSFAEVVRTMDDLVRSGKVRYVGACNLAGWQMQKFVEVTRQLGANPWVTLQGSSTVKFPRAVI